MTTGATTTRSGWKNRILLPVILILALSTGAASNAWAQMSNFQDVPSCAPYYGTVNLMFNRQITHGCVADPLQYCPDATLLRWQMAVFIIRAIYSGVNSDGDPERFSYSTNPYFTDVAYYDYANPANTPYGHPAFKYIQKMKEFGITSGCTVDHFCPEYATTNFAAAVFSVRGRQIRDQGGYGPVHVPTCSEYNCYSPYFYDIPTTDGAFPYIQRPREIVGSSIANAYCSSGYFCQNNDLKRGDMSTYVVYGIWGQPAQQPEQYYEAPGGGAALPQYLGSPANCGGVIFSVDRGIVQISPTEMYAYAKTWTAGGNASQYTNHVTNARVYRDSSIIIPSKNATDTTGSSQAYTRLPDDPGSFDPGVGVLTELATHSWSSSACGSNWIEGPYDLYDQIDVSYLSSISPAYGIAGSSAYVTIAGHNLYFAGPLNVTGGGVTVSNLTHPTVNSLQAMLTFDSAAAGEKKLSFTRTDRPFTTKDISLPVYDATPVIYSMSPSNFTAGAFNVPVTISGSGFGTNPTVSVSGYGVSARLAPGTPPTDTQIAALFDVAGDADSAVDVSVLANGTSTHNFSPAPNAATQPRSNTKLATITALTSVSQVPKYNADSVPILFLSTGDTSGRTITTSVNPNTASFSVTYSMIALSNPNSNCQATLTVPDGTSTGFINSPVSAGPGGCSRIYSVRARANGRDSSNDSAVVVPPQILIQMMYGEAHIQPTAVNDIISQRAIGVATRNRFSQPGWGGVSTYQQAITPEQFMGISTGITNGPDYELAAAAEVFSGTTGVSVLDAACFFSPTASGWVAIQQAFDSQTTDIPQVSFDPKCYAGAGFPNGRQIVIKRSIGMNGDGRGAPAFVFERPRPSGTDPAVIDIE